MIWGRGDKGSGGRDFELGAASAEGAEVEDGICEGEGLRWEESFVAPRLERDDERRIEGVRRDSRALGSCNFIERPIVGLWVTCTSY